MTATGPSAMVAAMRPIAATVPSITHGTRNVFADLGYPVARQGRLRLAFVLTQILERRRLTDAAAAKVLALSRREVAALRRHRLADFDMGRLMGSSSRAGMT